MSTDLHTLSGAYAVDALSPAEAEQFATHLEGCQACRDEVRELQEAAARMGASEAIAPPPALRARVLAAADQLPQLPPKVTPKVTSTSSAPPRRWVAWAGAVAAAVVLVAGGIVAINQLNGQETPVASDSVSQVFSASDAKTATVDTPQGQVRVAMSPDSGQMAVDTDRLNGLSQSRVYQMWAVHNGRATSVGVIDDPEAGKVMPIPASGTKVAITIEPEGGSKQPTSKPIVEVDPATV
jgi:anti-sigma-K factor RskA